MLKCQISQKDNYIYTLKDNNDNIYHLNMDFYGLTEKPQVGDYIYLDSELLKTNIPLYFEVVTNANQNRFSALSPQEIICLNHKNQKIYLVRVYG